MVHVHGSVLFSQRVRSHPIHTAFPVNVYFEVSRYVINEPLEKRLFVLHDAKEESQFGPLSLRYRSDRIWVEWKDGTIEWLKNRHVTLETPVDLKEFMWIKLKSTELPLDRDWRP